MDKIEEIARGVKQYLADRTGFGTDEGEGRVSAYYSGHWITLDTTEIARAAYEVMTRSDGEDTRGVEAMLARVEATIHQINGHWWNRRQRPEAPDLRALIDIAKARPEAVTDKLMIELLAQLEEIGGNKAGAFTLRNEGAVGSVFQAKLKALRQSAQGMTDLFADRLTRPEAVTDELLNNLLAVIHRDGGHYTGQHGLAQSCADAMQVSSNRIAWTDELREALKQASWDLRYAKREFGRSGDKQSARMMEVAQKAADAALSKVSPLIVGGE